jgi:hypothetical protein
MGKITNLDNSTDVLKSKALMVRLSRKKINRNKMDKDLSTELRDNKKVTDSSAVRVNKSIFTKASSDEYMKIYNEGSKYFYRVTLPWDDKGWRLLAIDLYEDFTKKMKSFTSQYRTQVVGFVEKINGHVEESKAMLGDAFSQADYSFISNNGTVDREYLLDQFGFEVEYNTVTDGNDLRAALTEDDRAIIAEQINKQALEKFAKANAHIINSLHEAVLAIHERLCKSDNVFRDTLITNLEELCDLIPKMNIAGDPAINEMAKVARDKLTRWDAPTLRDDDKARAKVAKDAAKILDNMKGVI